MASQILKLFENNPKSLFDINYIYQATEFENDNLKKFYITHYIDYLIIIGEIREIIFNSKTYYQFTFDKENYDNYDQQDDDQQDDDQQDDDQQDDDQQDDDQQDDDQQEDDQQDDDQQEDDRQEDDQQDDDQQNDDQQDDNSSEEVIDEKQFDFVFDTIYESSKNYDLTIDYKGIYEYIYKYNEQFTWLKSTDFFDMAYFNDSTFFDYVIQNKDMNLCKIHDTFKEEIIENIDELIDISQKYKNQSKEIELLNIKLSVCQEKQEKYKLVKRENNKLRNLVSFEKYYTIFLIFSLFISLFLNEQQFNVFSNNWMFISVVYYTLCNSYQTTLHLIPLFLLLNLGYKCFEI